MTLLLPAAAGSAGPEAGRAGGLALAILTIGPLAVGRESAGAAPEAAPAHPRMRQRELLTFDQSGLLPPRTRLLVLVHREGDAVWTAQAVAETPAGRTPAGERTPQGERTTLVEIGRAGDVGQRFEVQVVAARETAPSLLSEEMRAQVVLAGSPVVEVERRNVTPAVSITEIVAAAPAGEPPNPRDPQYVLGDRELMVHEVSLIGLAASDLPAGSRVGLAVQPAGSNDRWIMDDFLFVSTGRLRAHFGPSDDKSEASFHFAVTAFVADGEGGPPAGQKLPPAEWQRYRPHLLAESRPVRVVCWQRELRIEQIDDTLVLPGSSFPIRDRVNVRGAAPRRLAQDERVWLIRVPRNGEPSIVHSTSVLSLSGHWSMQAVDLSKAPGPCDLLAVVSRDVAPTIVRGLSLGAERAETSAYIAVQVGGTGTP